MLTRLFRSPHGLGPNLLALTYTLAGYPLGVWLLTVQPWWANLAGVVLTAHTLVFAAYYIHEFAHQSIFRGAEANNRWGTVMTWITGSCYAPFAALRRKHTMNIRQVYPPVAPDADVRADLSRIFELWAQARARFGTGGDFLFGSFGAADMMFAPVCTRIVTYSLPTPRFAAAYVMAVLNHPFMQDWIAGAQEEEWVIEKFEQPVA